VADGQKPPVDFGPTKNLKWKTPAPSGMSSPIIAGELLVISAFDGGKLYTVAYNRADGKEVWRKDAAAKTIEPYFKAGGSPAASTPATDGERIYSYFGSCGVICYDLTGKELWRYDLSAALIAGGFGTGTSPIVVDGAVILVRDEMNDSRIIAIDAATGSEKWKKKRRSISSYSTPVVWETVAGKQVAAAGHAMMNGYDLKSGDEKWSVTGLPSGSVTSPVIGDGNLYFAGYSPGGADDKDFQMPSFDDILKGGDTDKDGAISKAEADKTMLKDFFDPQDINKDGKITKDEWDTMIKFMREGKNTAFGLKPGGSGDITKTHVVWTRTKGLPYIASAIAYRGQLVMVKDGGLVTAYDLKSGKEVYTQERELASGQYYASPVAANGHIYFVTMDDGTVTVLEAGGDKPKVVAKNPKLGEKVFATPAIADDTLYIRGEKHLYAFAEKK
jgi:outer membrane protein assembly factor BamB